MNSIPKYPLSTIKKAGFTKNLIRHGKGMLQYGKQAIKNPGQAVKKGLQSGSTKLDQEKKFDVLDNVFRGALGKDRKVISMSALDGPKANAGMFGKATNYLRQQGIASVGRRTRGSMTRAQQANLIKQMKQKKLLHKTKGGEFVLHRNADVGELEKVYRQIQKMGPANKNISKFDRVRNAMNYAPVPGERGLILAGMAGGVAGQLGEKETAGGRKKSLAERVARAGTVGVGEAMLAPIGIANRLYGWAGMVAEQVGAMGLHGGLSAIDKKIDQRRARKAMQKQAGAYDSLSPLQRAMLETRLERGLSSYETPDELKVSTMDSFNPLKIRDNYRKHRQRYDQERDYEAARLFSKKASIPMNPRKTIRGLIK